MGYVHGRAELTPAPQRHHRYKIIDENPYGHWYQEWGFDRAEEAAAKAEDITGVSADLILSDLDSLGNEPWEWVDEETGREVILGLQIDA